MSEGNTAFLSQNPRLTASQVSASGDTAHLLALRESRKAGLSAVLDPTLEPLFRNAARLGALSAWWMHVPFAHWTIRATAPRLFVELGTHYGVSYSAFCEAVIEEGLPTRCHAVDSWRGDRHAGEYGEEVYADFCLFHDEHYGAFSTLLRCSFDDALAWFTDSTIDLLHIDGLHTYESVKRDFDNWRPKISDRGVVLFHDTNVRRDDFGVCRFWQELRGEYPSFEFLHGYGLGILAVGSNAPEPVLELCRLCDEQAIATLRKRFAFIGERWDRLNSVTRALGEVQALAESRRAEAAAATNAAQTEQATTASLHLLLAERDTTLAARESALAEANRHNAELAEKLSRAEETAAEHMAKSAEAEAALARAESDRASLREELDRALQTAAQFEDIADAAQSAIDTLRASLARSEEEMAEAESEREALCEERDQIAQERDQLAQKCEEIGKERDRVTAGEATWFDAAVLAAMERIIGGRSMWGWRIGRYRLQLSPIRGKGSPMQRADRARAARQWERAARFYLEALEQRSPNRPAIWVQLGHALKEAGKVAEAETAYRRAARLNAGNADTLVSLGQLLRQQGRDTEADSVFRRALDLVPSDERRAYLSGELAALGQPAE